MTKSVDEKMKDRKTVAAEKKNEKKKIKEIHDLFLFVRQSTEKCDDITTCSFPSSLNQANS